MREGTGGTTDRMTAVALSPALRLGWRVHRTLYRKGLTLEEAKAGIAAIAHEHAEAKVDVDLMLGFLAASTRGIAR